MNPPDKRIHSRVQFFLLHQDKDYAPVWVFNSDTPEQTCAGLVVNVSPSGVQVLTDASDPLTGQQFEITILGDDKHHPADLPPCRISLIWSRPEGNLYTRTGFSFMSEADAEPAFKSLLARYESGGHHFVRCTLRELDAAGA